MRMSVLMNFMILMILRKRTIFQMTNLAKRVHSPVSSLSNYWSDIMAMIELKLEEDLAKVDKVMQQEKIKSLTTTKGILDSGL